MLLARSWKAPVALLSCVLLIAGLAPSPLDAQGSKKVTEVVVTGNQNVNKEAILAVVELKPGADYTPAAVEADKSAIMGLGYFSAVSSRTEDVSGGVRVTYDVVENPMVKDIKITGNGPIPVEKILDTMRTKTDRVLNTATLNLDIEAIQKLYSGEGYVGTFVTEDIGIDRDTGALTIPILVPVVESVDITGNKKTKGYVFLREMKTKPGKMLNTKVLRDDMARIYNLDILEDIQAPKLETGSEIGKVKVVLPVTEKKTGQISLGLGYSSRQRLVGRAELTETNFRGHGQGLNVLWETGVSSGTAGRSSYELGFHEPWLDKHHTSLTTNIYNKVEYRFVSGLLGGSSTIGDTDNSYYERHKGGSLGLGRPLNDKTRAFVTLRSENVTPYNIDNLLTPEGIGTVSESVNSELQAFTQGRISTAALKLVNDTRDVIMNPATGGYNAISVEFGRANGSFSQIETDSTGAPIMTPDKNGVEHYTFYSVPQEGNIAKVMGEVRRYFSKGGPRETLTEKRRVIALRFQAGMVGWGGNGPLPFYEQFFVGGADTLRGYPEDRFWGDKMMLASAEYRVPVANSLVGVLFADYGDAWGGSPPDLRGFTQTAGFSGHLGVGLGIRVNTPIGNLRLDYGVGSEGGRTHFSIGQAF